LAKWYKFSISLATKCRIGFALAMLLIIAAGLYVPYQWMDKLVEQGKIDLARTEVNHVLNRHTQPERDSEIEGQLPPLVLDDELGKGQPVTRWIPVVKDSQHQTGDAFVKRGIKKFQDKTKDRPYIFKLHRPEQIPASGARNNAESQDDITTTLDANTIDPAASDSVPTGGVLSEILPWSAPARYLYPVRVKAKCLSENCHAGKTTKGKTTANEIEAAGQPFFAEGELVGVISVILPAGKTGVTLLFNRIFIVIGGILSGICAVVTFYLITQRFILQPVRFLRDAADHVTVEDEDDKETMSEETASWQKALSMMEQVKTGDEYERLAQAFHQMLTRLKLAHDRLRETNRALDLRLGELEAKNVALYESNKLKSEFLANVSHELRTPLNAIIGFAEILKEQSESRGDAKEIRYVSNVLNSGNLLLNFINELLDLAKIEAGKVEIHWEKCSLGEIVEALLNVTRPLAEEKKLTVKHFVDDQIGLLETDGGKLQQILFNLISNAIKFTPADGRIDLIAELIDTGDLFEGQTAAVFDIDKDIDRNHSMVKINVIDSGPGIAVEDREKIFEKFLQLDGSVTREHSGTGLGLAIVKELVEVLGGTITVGGNVGQGAIFTVLLPYK